VASSGPGSDGRDEWQPEERLRVRLVVCQFG
jgi:hypothetical protein